MHSYFTESTLIYSNVLSLWYYNRSTAHIASISTSFHVRALIASLSMDQRTEITTARPPPFLDLVSKCVFFMPSDRLFLASFFIVGYAKPTEGSLFGLLSASTKFGLWRTKIWSTTASTNTSSQSSYKASYSPPSSAYRNLRVGANTNIDYFLFTIRLCEIQAIAMTQNNPI